MEKYYVYTLFKGVTPDGKVSKLYVNEEAVDGLYIEQSDDCEVIHGIGDDGGQLKMRFDSLEEAADYFYEAQHAFHDDKDFVGAAIEYRK